jgi:hypothetical protein
MPTPFDFIDPSGDFGRQVAAKKTAGEAAHYGTLGRYLPPELRGAGPTIGQGIQGIGEMLRNPGGMSSGIEEAIKPRLGAEMRSIGQNYGNLRSEQAGAAARGNLPVSIKGALQKALNTNQARAEQGARNQALTESDQLRRGDVGQTYQLLDTILQFISSGQGQSLPGIQAANAMQSQNSQTGNAANTAMIGSLLQGLGQYYHSPAAGAGG